MCKGCKGLFIGTLVLWLLSGCADSKHSYRFFTENDSYHPVERPDANYTSGILFMASPTKLYEPGENDNISRLNPFKVNPNFPDQISREANISIEYGLGQTFYTPDDIAVDSLDSIDRNGRLLSADRPYAGLLFLQGAIHNHFYNGLNATGDVRRSVFGKIGLTGNGSFSEQMHTGVHRSRDLIIPRGWGLQVGQEIAFTVGVEQRNRLFAWRQNKLIGADLVSNVKGSLGSIYTAAEGGLTLRMGFNLPRSFQQNSITEQQIGGQQTAAGQQSDTTDSLNPGFSLDLPAPPDEPTTTQPELRKPSSWHLYGFIGHQTRLVFRDFSLDGRLFNDDIHTVEREPVVNEFQYGGQVRFADNWTIQALFVHRDKQFKTQRKEHSFGQYMIMYQRPFGRS